MKYPLFTPVMTKKGRYRASIRHFMNFVWSIMKYCVFINIYTTYYEVLVDFCLCFTPKSVFYPLFSYKHRYLAQRRRGRGELMINFKSPPYVDFTGAVWLGGPSPHKKSHLPNFYRYIWMRPHLYGKRKRYGVALINI